MPYAIMRIAKHSSHGTIGAAGSHMVRSRPTHNADPERAHLNEIIVGSEYPFGDVKSALTAAEEAYEENPALGSDGRKLAWDRKDSVRAIEFMITTSPEWDGWGDKEREGEWIGSSVDWLKKHFGAENLVHVQCHRDETTPHLTGFVVPVDPDTGRLNAKRWTGGRQVMSDMQTEYHQSVQGLGLERGEVKTCPRKHRTIQSWYAEQLRAENKIPERPVITLDVKPRLGNWPKVKAWYEETINETIEQAWNELVPAAKVGFSAHRGRQDLNRHIRQIQAAKDASDEKNAATISDLAKQNIAQHQRHLQEAKQIQVLQKLYREREDERDKEREQHAAQIEILENRSFLFVDVLEQNLPKNVTDQLVRAFIQRRDAVENPQPEAKPKRSGLGFSR